MPESHAQLVDAFIALSGYLQANGLTAQLARAEEAFKGSTDEDVAGIGAELGLTPDLLTAALVVRATVGRLSDVIHATTIALVLPHILEPGERLTNRPSLGAGNDPSRPFDLETDRRIAEFKVAQWKGKDTMRKRQVVADLVHLALDETGRRAQLYVVGHLPAKYLRSTRQTVAWALGRSSPHTRRRFAEEFDAEGSMTIGEFTAGPAAHIEVIDLSSLVPALAESD
ncbi:hypothetical protein [Mycolicibacterium fortuitum]|uniref:hypothetical protein n=1 Tax=Mycolicibacterium fortuitum TaxID=1766 RepID=UPI0009C0DE68|nr:hypothetical protein [Mycolicibacterium fortuitum]